MGVASRPWFRFSMGRSSFRLSSIGPILTNTRQSSCIGTCVGEIACCTAWHASARSHCWTDEYISQAWRHAQEIQLTGQHASFLTHVRHHISSTYWYQAWQNIFLFTNKWWLNVKKSFAARVQACCPKTMRYQAFLILTSMTTKLDLIWKARLS